MIHHVMVRGLRREVLFTDDLDRAIFIDLLRLAVVRFRISVLAFALMSNHVHLLLRRATIPLWRVMLFLNARYATAFNQRHGFAGYVFDRRYKNKPVRDLQYQKIATLYIHRNPVEAGLVPFEGLARDPWSSHGIIAGARKESLIDETLALAPWGDHESPREAYLRDFADYAGQPVEADSLYPDSDRFPATEAPVVEMIHAERATAALVEFACTRVGVSSRDLRSGGRAADVAKARSIAAFLLDELLGLKRSTIAELSGVSDSAVTRCIRRGAVEAELRGAGLYEALARVLAHARR